MYNSSNARRLRDGDAARSSRRSRAVSPVRLPRSPRRAALRAALRQAAGDAVADGTAPASRRQTRSDAVRLRGPRWRSSSRLPARRHPGRSLDRAARRDLCLGSPLFDPPLARRGSSRSRRRGPLARYRAPRPRREAPPLRRFRNHRVTGSSIPVTRPSSSSRTAPTAFACAFPKAAVYRSAAIAGLELDLEAFWRAIPR